MLVTGNGRASGSFGRGQGAESQGGRGSTSRAVICCPGFGKHVGCCLQGFGALGLLAGLLGGFHNHNQEV